MRASLLAGGALAAGILLVRIVDARATSAPRMHLAKDQAALPSRPEWIAVDPVGKALVEIGLEAGSIPLGEPDLAARIGHALETSPWIRSSRVEVGWRRLEVHAEFRRPVLFVPSGDGGSGCYVDDQGVVLPAEEAVPDALRACMILEGFSSQPPRSGAAFEDARVKAAARLAGFLESDRTRLGLASIGAPPSPDRSGFLLRAKNGSRVRWGDPFDGVANQLRLARLLDHERRFGGLDQPAGPYEFDLRDMGSPRPSEGATLQAGSPGS